MNRDVQSAENDRLVFDLAALGYPGPSGIIDHIMVSLEETISTPLVVTEQGTIRVKGSRVTFLVDMRSDTHRNRLLQ
jgi:hypothetical protein